MASAATSPDHPDALPSIGAVSDQLGLEPHVLRYWESEFEELSPAKDSAGRRVYREEDIAALKRIHHLLKVEKYTLEGARQVLARGPDDTVHTASKETLADLKRLRTFLMEVLEQIEDSDRERGSNATRGAPAEPTSQPT